MHDKPRLQNIPVRTELGKRVRAAFEKDHPMPTVDLTQLELRLLAQCGKEALKYAASTEELFRVIYGEPEP